MYDSCTHVSASSDRFSLFLWASQKLLLLWAVLTIVKIKNNRTRKSRRQSIHSADVLESYVVRLNLNTLAMKQLERKQQMSCHFNRLAFEWVFVCVQNWDRATKWNTDTGIASDAIVGRCATVFDRSIDRPTIRPNKQTDTQTNGSPIDRVRSNNGTERFAHPKKNWRFSSFLALNPWPCTLKIFLIFIVSSTWCMYVSSVTVLNKAKRNEMT